MMNDSITLQPVLENDIVYIRPLRHDDFEDLYAVASDPLLWQQHPEPLRYQREIFDKFFRKAMDSAGALVLIDKQKQNIIGCSRYYEHKEQENSIAIGYTFIAREYWGTGHNPSIKQLMLDHILHSVDTVYFHIGIHNIRSQKAIERLGARKLDMNDPQHENHLVYIIDRDLWKELSS